jgi:nucleoside-diphosphate-sugar epimerase
VNPLQADLDHVLNHTQGVWDSIRGQNIFVTGGTGFFGRWLLESFAHANDKLDLGARMVVLSRNGDSFRRKARHLAEHPNISLLEGDVRSFTFPSGNFSHVLHAATETVPTGGGTLDPVALFERNLLGTRRVLEFAARGGVKRLLFTSSGAVYGPQPNDLARVPENYTGAPDPMLRSSAYGESKRAAEFLCVATGYNAGIAVTVARCFAFVGPHLALDANYAIGNFTGDALRGGPIELTGDGTSIRSYLYAADLAIWIWTILLRGESGAAYNVGSDAPITILDLAKTVAEVVCPEAQVKRSAVRGPGASMTRYVPAITRARSELGLEPWIDLREGIRRMAEWNRLHAL